MPQPGDHSWVIAIAYVAVSAAALLARRVSSDAAERSFWGLAALMMLAFGLAKGLRLQGMATNWIRTEARTYQLYDYRQMVEYPFVIAVLGAALLIGWQSRSRIFRRGRNCCDRCSDRSCADCISPRPRRLGARDRSAYVQANPWRWHRMVDRACSAVFVCGGCNRLYPPTPIEIERDRIFAELLFKQPRRCYGAGISHSGFANAPRIFV